VGGTTGTVLLTAATCNTVAKIMPFVNATTYWRMFPLALTYADYSNNPGTSDTGIFNVAAAADASKIKGTVLSVTGSGALGLAHVATTLLPAEKQNDIRAWIIGNNAVNPNPFAGTRTVLLYDVANVTGTGTFFRKVVAALPAYTASTSTTETEYTLLYTPGAATTVNSTADYTPYGVIGPKDMRMVVKYGNATTVLDALTVGTQYSYGLVIPAR
jgi:hypothetical protein